VSLLRHDRARGAHGVEEGAHCGDAHWLPIGHATAISPGRPGRRRRSAARMSRTPSCSAQPRCSRRSAVAPTILRSATSTSCAQKKQLGSGAKMRTEPGADMSIDVLPCWPWSRASETWWPGPCLLLAHSGTPWPGSGGTEFPGKTGTELVCCRDDQVLRARRSCKANTFGLRPRLHRAGSGSHLVRRSTRARRPRSVKPS
jgi:hypothetical protein